MASMFQPDYAGSVTSQYEPFAEASPTALFGVGAYVDVKFTRWFQIEAEGRWQRFNQNQNIHQDNYLIGPRVPIHRIRRATFYGKALAGFSNMSFNDFGAHGNFTTLAFGGGADIRLTHRISIRAFDGEYQYWPQWGNSSLTPYGVSMGVGYKIF
jgi:hypothetical protein